MKTLLVGFLALIGSMMVGGGCATPAYSAHERWQMIGRNWGYEWRQAQDDIDHVLLLRPASDLKVWNVR